jgi:2-polyprenyl-3-methyl-5-hydroxy-6-metoxy-1,4-benzoquinol methylase
MLPIETVPSHHGRVETAAARYTLKADRYSSHSVILGWLAEGRGRRLLDVGAADGLLSRHLTERGWKVTAIEADAAMAAAGAAHCERMLIADLNRGVPPLDGEFDAIVCADVLEHLADPETVLTALVRSLAAGGDVVISVPNVAHLWMRLSLMAGRFDYADRGILDRTHLRFFTRKTLDALLAAAGLAAVRRTATPVPLHQVVPPRWHGGALAAVHALSASSARALPRVLGYQFVVWAKRHDNRRQVEEQA